MQNNAEQIDYWNGEAGETWVMQQQVMDATLQPVTAALLQKAAAQPGEVALDIGCGCGDTSLALASAGLQVRGVDISQPMLNHARGRAPQGTDVEFLLADASTHGFEPEFNLILSRFGVMFFSDPGAAFSNIRRASRADGRLCFVCWQSPKVNPWVTLPMATVEDLLPDSEPMDPTAPGPFAFADAERLQTILQHAGWQDVSIDPLPWAMKIGNNLEQAANFVTRIGPLSRAIRELSEETQAAVSARLRAALQPLEGEYGISLQAASWLVTARNG